MECDYTDGLTLGGMVACIVLCSTLCSVASFYIGRRKEAEQEGKEEGTLKTDLKYIKETVQDTTKSIDALTVKLEAQNARSEQDYRDLLVKFTELKSCYKSLHIRVDNIEKSYDHVTRRGE